MYAVIESGGQQHRVAPGDVIKVAKMAGSAESECVFDKVLLVSKDDKVYLGSPYLEAASVKGEIQGNTKSKKVLVFKQKPRKGFRKLRGHRQDVTVVKIRDIVFGG